MSGKAMLTIVVSRKARKAPVQAIATAASMTTVIHRGRSIDYVHGHIQTRRRAAARAQAPGRPRAPARRRRAAAGREGLRRDGAARRRRARQRAAGLDLPPLPRRQGPARGRGHRGRRPADPQGDRNLAGRARAEGDAGDVRRDLPPPRRRPPRADRLPGRRRGAGPTRGPRPRRRRHRRLPELGTADRRRAPRRRPRRRGCRDLRRPGRLDDRGRAGPHPRRRRPRAARLGGRRPRAGARRPARGLGPQSMAPLAQQACNESKAAARPSAAATLPG